jgi:uncharacterized membrane protein
VAANAQKHAEIVRKKTDELLFLRLDSLQRSLACLATTLLTSGFAVLFELRRILRQMLSARDSGTREKETKAQKKRRTI